MLIAGLHDADKEHLRGKGRSFPNLALMKLAAFHRAQGDMVEWWKSSKSSAITVANIAKINISKEASVVDDANLSNTINITDSNRAYDKIYSSKIFDFTPENPYLPSNTIRGGVGYGIETTPAKT